MVLGHDLRNGDGNNQHLRNRNGQRMTLITFEDGKPLMKDDGKIGTGQECCCEDEQEEGNCQNCELNCCLLIRGRNLCEPGTTVQEDFGDGETWLVSQFTGFFGTPVFLWFSQENGENYSIRVEISPCKPDGTRDAQVTSLSSGGANGELGSTEHQFLNAKAILDGNGCLSGIRLNSLVVVCDELHGCGITTPESPDITFICEEFDFGGE